MRRSLLSTAALAALLLAADPIGAQTSTHPGLAALDDSVRGLIPAGAPGVAIGVVRDGAVVHQLFAGEADLSHAAPVGPATRFNIASNAKQYTAAIILGLVREGRLSLDGDVRAFVPGLLPDVRETITIRHLLTHTSGIRDVYDLWALGGRTWWQLFVGNREAVALLRDQRALNFAPGAEYLYSNSNYLLLTQVVESVTDSTFAAVSAERFARWGMPGTAFLTDYLDVIPQRARSYGSWNGWKEYPSITSLHGDGGLFTTLPDQLAWEVRLQATAGASGVASLERMSQAPVPGAEAVRYGWGVEFDTHRGLPIVFHDGSTGAYNATFVRFPEQRVAVVVLSNNGTIGVHALALRYADEVLGPSVAQGAANPSGPDRVGPRVDPRDWLGDYRASTGALISLAQTDSGLVRRIPGSPDVRLLPDTGNVYRYASNPNLRMALTRDADGAPEFTIYLSSQKPNVGRRLTPRPAALPASSWSGRFRNAETGAELVIRAVVADSVSAALNGREIAGRLVRPDLLSLGGYEWKPTLGASGRVETLLLEGGRIRRVEFARGEDPPSPR